MEELEKEIEKLKSQLIPEVVEGLSDEEIANIRELLEKLNNLMVGR